MNIQKNEERIGTHKTGSLRGDLTPEQITARLGFEPEGESSDGKVFYFWQFTVDGIVAAIWDFKGVRWSVYDPRNVVPSIFTSEA